MDSFAKLRIEWHRSKELERIDEDGEDSYTESSINYEIIPLDVLSQGNYFRTWPISKETPAGEQDSQNLSIYIHKKYLNDLGYITQDKYFAFNPSRDFFIIEGKKYLAKGDTSTAQANSKTLLFQINLLRDEVQSGDFVNNDT